MKEIEPYRNINDAIQSLDNGGVGGLFNDKQQMVLFLEMSILKFSKVEKEKFISMLDNELNNSYLKYKSQQLLPSEANSKGIISSNAIITGIPKLIDSKSDFSGFIMFPIMAGNVMTFMMVPLFEKYDVYELKDEESSETFLIAHLKDSEKLPPKKFIFGGVLKELKTEKNETEAKGKFLEALYYIGN